MHDKLGPLKSESRIRHAVRFFLALTVFLPSGGASSPKESHQDLL
jgi:hypothetical protein